MKKEFDWFDKEKNVSLLKKFFYGSLVFLILIDFFILCEVIDITFPHQLAVHHLHCVWP